jgi:hypothetical protein
MLASPEGDNVTAGTRGTVEMGLLLPAVQAVTPSINFDGDTTTAEMNRMFLDALGSADLPDSVSVTSLSSDKQLYPAIFSNNPFEYTMHWSVQADGNPGFSVGAASAFVPEPSIGAALLVGFFGVLVRRRTCR